MVLPSAPAGAGVLVLVASALAPAAGAFVAPGASGRPRAEPQRLGLCACAALLLARSARAPKKAEQRRVAVRAFESETGGRGGFWDPLGLSSDGSAFNFARRREVELKHGRVSMFATIGYIVPEYYKLPGFLSPSYGIQFSEVPNGLGALSKVPALGWLQIITLAGITEVQIYKDPVKGEPGNYGAGFLGVKSIGLTSNGFTDPEYRNELNAELANGTPSSRTV
ncbi:unnamed protein product [Prorocentrum cordatum]|uniref:Uncharacterized protein n=1 Tax=Prorocentrum cordatum TaxID=2364126 RepID=A0ABN9X5B3_9DINO|nr:unnamed protein product [Polarella glacialis]